MNRRNRPLSLGEEPVEQLVTDEVRRSQLDAVRRGEEPRHSVAIATNAPPKGSYAIKMVVPR